MEFYNPVHDITLPVVRSALRGFADPPVFEVPLVYQSMSGPHAFELQRVPPSLESRGVSVDLTHEELAKKLSVVRGEVYGGLFSQMGSLISGAISARPVLPASRGAGVGCVPPRAAPHPERPMRNTSRG